MTERDSAPRGIGRLYWRWRVWRARRALASGRYPPRPSTDELLRRIDEEEHRAE